MTERFRLSQTFRFFKSIIGLLLACFFLDLSISHVSESSQKAALTVLLFSQQNGKKLFRFPTPNAILKKKTKTNKQAKHSES